MSDRIQFSYRSTGGELIARVFGRPDGGVVVSVDRSASPPSVRELPLVGREPTGRPAFSRAGSLVAIGRREGNGGYSIEVSKRGEGTLLRASGAGNLGSMDLDPGGNRLAAVIYQAFRSASMGGQRSTSPRLIILDLEDERRAEVEHPGFDALNGVVFLDPDTVLFNGKRRGVGEFVLYVARRRGPSWTASPVHTPLRPWDLIPSRYGSSEVWLGVMAGTNAAGMFDYGIQRCRLSADRLTPVGGVVTVGYWWTASYDEEAGEIVFGLDPNRVGGVTHTAIFDEQTGVIRPFPELLDVLLVRQDDRG